MRASERHVPVDSLAMHARAKEDEHHEACFDASIPPFQSVPTANAIRVRDEDAVDTDIKFLYGGERYDTYVTRLIQPHRLATSNDLVIDLVFVFILAHIVEIFEESSLRDHFASLCHPCASESNSSVYYHSGLCESSSCRLHTTSAQHEEQAHHRSLWSSFDDFKARTHDVSSATKIGLSIRDVCAIFVPMWFAQHRIARLLNMFEKHDIIHLVFFCLNITILFFISGGIEKCIAVPTAGGQPQCGHFIFALCALKMVQVFYMVYAGIYNPEFRHGIYRWHIITGLTIIMWLAAHFSVALNNVEVFLMFWWSAVVLDFLPMIIRMSSSVDYCLLKYVCRCFDRRNSFLPPVHPHLVQERFNLFLILCMGESLASCKLDNYENINTRIVVRTFCIIAMNLCLKFLTLDFVEAPLLETHEAGSHAHHSTVHAMLVSPLRAGFYYITLLPCCLGVLLSGGAMSTLLHIGIAVEPRWVLSIGIFLVLISTTLMQIVHKGVLKDMRNMGKAKREAIRVGLSLISLLIGFYNTGSRFETWLEFEDDNIVWGSELTFLTLHICNMVVIMIFDRYSRSPKRSVAKGPIPNEMIEGDTLRSRFIQMGRPSKSSDELAK